MCKTKSVSVVAFSDFKETLFPLYLKARLSMCLRQIDIGHIKILYLKRVSKFSKTGSNWNDNLLVNTFGPEETAVTPIGTGALLGTENNERNILSWVTHRV